MGCKFACTCGGICPGCTTYEKEEYYGHAEDILAQAHGYRNADEWEQDEREQKRIEERMQNEYDEEQRREYEKEMEVMFDGEFVEKGGE